MLTSDDIRILRRGYSACDALSPAEAWRQIGQPEPAALVAFCRAQMAHPDRNQRVLMLRALAHQQGAEAAAAVLAGLRDEARRVIAVAIQACPNFLADEAIVARLEAITRDCRQKRKLRRRALSMLAGHEGRAQGDLSPAQFAALRRLRLDEAYRFPILFGLARLPLKPRTEALLREFAASADAAERALASRALGGERVIHIDAYAKDAALHARIMATCERAHGRMFYWIPRQGLPALTLP